MALTDHSKSAKSRARSGPYTLGIRQRRYLTDCSIKVAQILTTARSTNFWGQVKFSDRYYYNFVLQFQSHPSKITFRTQSDAQ